jgi:hypothetical protein
VSATTDVRPAVSVDELKRAWAAVEAGQFRTGLRSPPPASDAGRVAAAEWIPAEGEQTIAVVGCAGSVGASTVALAIGLAAPDPVRVVECCSAAASGVAAASTTELGLHPAGWRRGRRDHVLLERVDQTLARVEDVPLPVAADHESQLTIIDASWDGGQLVATDSWLRTAVRTADAIVVVATATVPSFRRLEATLDSLRADRTTVAVVGPRRKRWPKGLEHSAGPAARRALTDDRVVEIPTDRRLASAGLDSAPIPGPLAAAARGLLTRLPITHA